MWVTYLTELWLNVHDLRTEQGYDEGVSYNDGWGRCDIERRAAVFAGTLPFYVCLSQWSGDKC